MLHQRQAIKSVRCDEKLVLATVAPPEISDNSMLKRRSLIKTYAPTVKAAF